MSELEPHPVANPKRRPRTAIGLIGRMAMPGIDFLSSPYWTKLAKKIWGSREYSNRSLVLHCGCNPLRAETMESAPQSQAPLPCGNPQSQIQMTGFLLDFEETHPRCLTLVRGRQNVSRTAPRGRRILNDETYDSQT